MSDLFDLLYNLQCLTKKSTFRLRVCIGVRHSECRRLFRQDQVDQRGLLHDALRGGGGQALQGQVFLHQAKPSYITEIRIGNNSFTWFHSDFVLSAAYGRFCAGNVKLSTYHQHVDERVF
jgi:hypothetical protein